MLNQFSRTQLLLGKESIERLQNSRHGDHPRPQEGAVLVADKPQPSDNGAGYRGTDKGIAGDNGA